jgi:hypothetical protein
MPDEVLDVEVMPAATPLPPSLVVAPGSVVEAVEIARSSSGIASRHQVVFPCSDATGKIVRTSVTITDLEFRLVNRYVDTLNARAIAAEFSISLRQVRNILQRERINAYVAWRVQTAASAAALTLDKVLAKLNDAVDGTSDLSEAQLSAIGHAARILKPAAVGGGVTVNMQNNFGRGAPAAESPYAKMERGALIARMRDVVDEAGPRIDVETP